MNRASIFLVTLILCGIAAVILSVWQFYSPSHLAFDASRWKAGDAYLRGRMVSSLIDGKILEGMSRTEIVELLGPPDEKQLDAKMRYGFFLTGSTFFNWKEWLCISFDRSGKCVEVESID